MRNGDMSIYPESDYVEDCGPLGDAGPHMVEIKYGGLTKREYFAGLAMQAFIMADHKNGSEKRLNEDNALMAVDAADALLAELEATND